jgi:hypothetical protein
MAGELVFVPRAASPTLFLLAVLGFVDFITGLSVHMVQPKLVFERAEQAPLRQASGPS